MITEFPVQKFIPPKQKIPQYPCDSCKHFPPPQWENWDYCLKGKRMTFLFPVYGDPHAFGYSPKDTSCYEPRETEEK